MHPPEEILLSLASGEADLTLRAAVEGHLSSCAPCLATLRELTQVGSALLSALPPEPVPDRLWQGLLARLGPPGETAASPDPLAGLPLPAGTRRELPPLNAPRWHSLWGSGARWAFLARDRATASLLILAHMAAGHGFPRHLHPGREDVLVLTGGYEDERGRYEAGHYTVYEPGSEHRPRTEPDEECWTLVRLESPIRFLGWRGWLQRLYGR